MCRMSLNATIRSQTEPPRRIPLIKGMFPEAI